METLKLMVDLLGPFWVVLWMAVAVIYSWKGYYVEANTALLWCIVLMLMIKL